MARLMIAALEAGGHDVEVASRRRSYDGIGDPEAQRVMRQQGEDEAERIAARLAALPPGDRPALWFTYHLYYKAPDWIGPRVCRRLGIPYVVAEASHAPKRAGGPWAMGHAAVGDAISAAALVLALTRPDMECLRPLVIRQDRLVWLPPFIDVAPFAAAAANRTAHREEIAGRHGLDPQSRWLLTVAMMRPGDKLDSYRLLAGALGRLPRRDWTLLVVGGGDARTAVEQALGALPPGRVVYAGIREPDQMPGYCAASDIYVWPATGEAYGMAFLEAQAAGLPVVAGRVRGVPDVTRENETALLVKENDIDEFAAQIARLLDDDGLRRRMGAAALAFAGGERNLETAARRLDRHLRDAVAQGSLR